MATGQEIYEQIKREFACVHAKQVLCKRTTVNGRIQYFRHCVRCGEKTGALRHAELTEADKASAGEADEQIRRAWYDRINARSKELHGVVAAQEQEKWWEAYSEYLETPKWRAKSRAVIRRDKVCQACMTRPAVQAHHKDYRHVGDEPLFDLVGVCVECHKKLHDKGAIAYALRRNFVNTGVLASSS